MEVINQPLQDKLESKELQGQTKAQQYHILPRGISNILYNLCTGGFFVLAYTIGVDAEPNGTNSRFLLMVTALIRFIYFNSCLVLITWLIVRGSWKTGLYNTCLRIISFSYYGWALYIVLNHQLGEVSGWTYAALLYVVGEAWLWVVWYTIEAIMLILMLVIIGFRSLNPIENEVERRLRNVDIARYIRTWDVTNVVGNRWHEEETCTICFDSIDFQGHTVVSIPCDSKHKFHKHCISLWLRSNKNCPTCEQEMPQEVLSQAREEVQNLLGYKKDNFVVPSGKTMADEGLQYNKLHEEV